MSPDSLPGFISNVALLFGLVAIQVFRGDAARNSHQKFESAPALGIAAIFVLQRFVPIPIAHSFYLDTSAQLFLLSGLFFNIPTTLAAAAVAIFTFVFAWEFSCIPASLIILFSAGTGLLWRQFAPHRNRWFDFLGLGIVSTIITLAVPQIWTPTFFPHVLASFGFPVLIGFPLLTLLFALMMKRIAGEEVLALSTVENLVSQDWQQMIHEVIHSAPISIAVLDKDLHFIYVSTKWLQDYQLTEEDLIGIHHYVAFPEIPQRWRDVHQRVLKGEKLNAEEDVFIRANGDTEIIRWTCQPWHTKSGEIGGIVLYTEYLTEQKKAEQIYQAIIQNSIEGFWVSDASNRFREVNHTLCESLGYSEEELLGLHISAIDAVESKAEIEKRQQQIISDGSARYRSKHRRKDGSIIDVDVSATYLNIDGGRFYVFVHDITDEANTRQELVTERQRLANILEGTGVGTWEWDIVSGETIFNERWAELIGYTLNELEPISIKTWESFVHPDDLKIASQALQEHFDGLSEDYVCEQRMLHKNGDWIWILDRGKVYERDSEGKPLKMAGTHLDITQRKLNELRLSQNAAEQEILLKASVKISESLNQEAVLQTIADSSTELLKIETAAVYLLEEDELYLGGTTPPLPPNLPDHHRRAKLSDNPHIQRVVESGEPLAVEDPDHEEWSETEAEIVRSRNLRSLLYVPIMGKDGMLGVMITGTTNEIRSFSQSEINLCMTISHQLSLGINNAKMHESLQKHAEELRNEIAERTQIAKAFRELAENSPFGIVISDNAGNFTFVNKAFCNLVGFEVKELASLTAWQLVQPDEVDKLKKIVAHALEDRRQIEYHEGTLIHKTGEVRIIEFTITTTHWGGEVRPMAMLRDITEQRQAEKEREKLQQQLAHAMRLESVGRLAGGIAHDFNNMLAVIISATEMSLASVGPNSEAYELLKEIERASVRSADLTRQLLAFSRKQLVQPVSVNLNQIILEQEKMLSRLIGEDIDVSMNLDDNLWNILIDPSQIDQILANLSVNARDAIEGVGTLAIETVNVRFDEDFNENGVDVKKGEYIQFTLSDSGKGMSEEIVEHIFEPFYTTKDVGEGTGLGLATVYGIVKQNDGTIHVTSTPGNGTSFKILLPRYNGETLGRSEEELSSSDAGDETILIVEDEKSILNLSQKYLEQLGYTVLSANTPLEAINIASEYDKTIDLMLTDVVMPTMDGKQLKSKIESIIPSIRTIFMSGYSANVIEQRGILDSGISFIEKPFTMKSLANQIRRFLDRE